MESPVARRLLTTADIKDGGITAPKLADNAVTTAKITDANVTTPKIADSNVTTPKIADDNVTNAKLADDVKVGSLASLSTDDKTSVQAAVNEVVTKVGDIDLTSITYQELGDEQPASATVDDDGRLIEAITTGGKHYATGEITSLEKAPNTATAGNIIADRMGRVLLGVRDDGLLEGDFRPNIYGADINHVLGNGQSLSVGAEGTPVVSTEQPYDNLSFYDDDCLAFAPLTGASVRTDYNGETPHAGMANQITYMMLERTATDRLYRTLHSSSGSGGAAYVNIKKNGTGTSGYDRQMPQVSAAIRLAQQMRLSYRVACVTLVHGESDHDAGTANYQECLEQLQRDYDDIRLYTGQADPIPMFLCQLSSWTKYGEATSLIPYAQLAASEQNPGKIYLVTPKYFMSYVDGVHMPASSYRWLGEYYAKAYVAVVIERRRWRPLSPASATLSGAVITLRFHVPVAPIVLDTTRVSNPGNYGFEYTDDSSPPAISSVAVEAPNIVRVTLAGTPTGANKKIRYAYTGTINADAGPTTGARGNLRDSDATISRTGNELFNWCVHFSMDVS